MGKIKKSLAILISALICVLPLDAQNVAQMNSGINLQTGSNYGITCADSLKLVQLSNASAQTPTMPSAASCPSPVAGTIWHIQNIGAGLQTITPTTSTVSYANGYAYISAAASVQLPTGWELVLYTDGTNYIGFEFAITANVVESSGCTTGSHCILAGLTGYYWCDTSAECYWTLDTPVAGKQYCFGNYSGQTNVLSITSTTSVYIVYKGANGTVTTGTLVSGGAAGDFVCMEGVDATHYMVTGAGYGTWTNN